MERCAVRGASSCRTWDDVFLSLIEDTSGAHDLLVGGSTPASTLAAFGEALAQHPRQFPRGRVQARAGAARHPALRDLLCAGLARCGRSLRLECRAQAARRFRRPARRNRSRARAVELRRIRSIRRVLPPLVRSRWCAIARRRAAADDPCRTTSPEIGRAFQFTDRLYA